MRAASVRIMILFLVGMGWLGGEIHVQAMSEAEIRRLYLEVVESAVDVYEPLWVDDSVNIPQSGFFDFRKYGNWMDEPYATIIVVPGNGMVAFCYAVLLTETDKTVFTEKQVPREVLWDHARKAIRWCCATSVYVEHPYSYLPNTRPEFLEGAYWRRQYGYRADEVGWLSMAAAKLWDRLDEETRKLVEEVLIGGAPPERQLYTWKTPQGGNQDQVKQDLSSTVGAAFLFPHHPHHARYMDAVRGYGLDMVSTLHDYACDAIADGTPVREQAKVWNLYPDYSSDHHGWHNIWYGCDMLMEGFSYVHMLSAMTGIPVPETYSYPGNGFEDLLERIKVLCLPQGEPASPHGNEYDSYYGAGLLAYTYGAVIKKDPVAAAFEDRAAQLLQRHSRAIRMYDYHRDSWAKAATAFLLHKYYGPRVEPISFDEANRQLEGTYYYRWHQNLVQRGIDKWASFAWGSISSQRAVSAIYGNGFCGYVFPVQMEDDPEPLVYGHPSSLIGSVTEFVGEEKTPGKAVPETQYRFHRTDRGFHTAGVAADALLDRFYAFFSFAEGPCVMQTVFRAREACNAAWSGLPIYFYARPGLTQSRAFHSEQGEQPLERDTRLESSWWSVDGRLGMIALGGNRRISVRRSPGYNWARQPYYRDQCNAVFVSPMPEISMTPGDLGVDLTALIYTNTPPETMAALVSQVENLAPSLPPGWRGVLAPDGKSSGRKLAAVAHLYGETTRVTLSLSTPEGAPVFADSTLVAGRSGTLVLQLDPWETFAGECELVVATPRDDKIRVEKISPWRYRLQSVDKKKVAARLQYAGNEPATLRVVDESGKTLKEIAYAPKTERSGFTWHVTGVQFLEIHPQGSEDTIGPAVEISEIEVREDGRLAVNVAAEDQSGIERVELFGDGRLLSAKSEAPFLWTHRPGKGAHTYFAVAYDASSLHNPRASFRRTVFVNP